MPKITPNLQKKIFSQEVLDELPKNNEVKSLNARLIISEKNREHWSNPEYQIRRRISHDLAMGSDSHRESKRKAIYQNQSILNSPEALEKKKRTKIKNGIFHDQDFWQEIYDQFWDHNRNDKVFRKSICEKYQIPESTLHTLINGATGMNVSESLISNHKEKLLNWQRQYGDLRFNYTIITAAGQTYTFDNLADAGRWFADFNQIDVIANNQGKTNYGNVVWGYFKTNTKIRKGRFKDWSFIKLNRNCLT